MPHNEVMLTGDISQALLSIPITIKITKDLLKQSGGDAPASAIEQIEVLQNSIVTFCGAHKWLREAKDFHDSLTVVDSALEGAYHEVLKARDGNRFDPEMFRAAEARKTWLRAKSFALERLLSFARHIAYIDRPLQTDPTGAFISGPSWARRCLELARQIDDAFEKFDKDDLNVKKDISRALDDIVHLIRSQLIIANEMIRTEASALADELNKLQGALSNV